MDTIQKLLKSFSECTTMKIRAVVVYKSQKGCCVIIEDNNGFAVYARRKGACKLVAALRFQDGLKHCIDIATTFAEKK